MATFRFDGQEIEAAFPRSQPAYSLPRSQPAYSVAPAQVLVSPLSATDEALTEPNAWQSVKWNGGSTKDEGLAALLGDATWSPTLGQLGVDFGNTTPEGSLTAGSTHPAWTGSYLNISLYIAAGNQVVEGYDIDGHIEVGAMNAELLVKNCVIRGVSGSPPFRNIVQNDTSQPVHVEDCLLQRNSAQHVIFGNGHVKRCYLYDTDQIGISFNGSVGVIDECFIRQVCMGVGAHGDGVFVSNADDITITRTTIYVPDGALPLGEGATGPGTGNTSSIFLTPGTSGMIASGFIAGNLLAGGSYALYLGGGAGATIQNICVVNNVIASGADYASFGTANIGALHSDPGYVRKNLLFYGNVDENGAAITQAGENLNGIWNFDKAAMDARTRYVGKKVGYLDWNGDCEPAWDRSA